MLLHSYFAICHVPLCGGVLASISYCDNSESFQGVVTTSSSEKIMLECEGCVPVSIGSPGNGCG